MNDGPLNLECCTRPLGHWALHNLGYLLYFIGISNSLQNLVSYSQIFLLNMFKGRFDIPDNSFCSFQRQCLIHNLKHGGGST